MRMAFHKYTNSPQNLLVPFRKSSGNPRKRFGSASEIFACITKFIFRVFSTVRGSTRYAMFLMANYFKDSFSWFAVCHVASYSCQVWAPSIEQIHLKKHKGQSSSSKLISGLQKLIASILLIFVNKIHFLNCHPKVITCGKFCVNTLIARK